jgi:hypothetical protein
VEWARTLRIDAPPGAALQTRIAAALARDGIRIDFGPQHSLPRTYALVQGPAGADPVEVEQRFAEGRWYGEAIIALAIEPTPADALPALLRALNGPGSPAGVSDCQIAETQLLVEMQPSLTQPGLVLRIVDVELRRTNGSRRVKLLSPLPVDLVARIAAAGLQAPEIAPNRILESLLESAHVE